MTYPFYPIMYTHTILHVVVLHVCCLLVFSSRFGWWNALPVSLATSASQNLFGVCQVTPQVSSEVEVQGSGEGYSKTSTEPEKGSLEKGTHLQTTM